jgi:hypothetical protein
VVSTGSPVRPGMNGQILAESVYAPALLIARDR